MFFGSDARVPVLPWRHSRKNLWNVLHRIPRARVGRVVRCILRLPYVTYDDYAVIWVVFFFVQIFLLLSFPHLICAAGNIVSQSFFYGCPSLDATASADSWCLKALLRYMSRNTKASHQRLLSSFEGDNLGEVITREAMFRGVAICKSLYSEYKQRGDNMWNCCFLFSISVAAIEIIIEVLVSAASGAPCGRFCVNEKKKTAMQTLQCLSLTHSVWF